MNDFIEKYLKNKYKAQGRVYVVTDKKTKTQKIKVNYHKNYKIERLEQIKLYLKRYRSKIEIQDRFKMSERSVLNYFKELKNDGLIERKIKGNKKGYYIKQYRVVG